MRVFSQTFAKRFFDIAVCPMFRTTVKTLFSQTVEVDARISTSSRFAKIVKGTSNSSLYLEVTDKIILM